MQTRALEDTIAALAAGLIEPARTAGRLQLAERAAGAPVERKADNSPVTAADRKSEALIAAALAELAPGVPIVAEEAMESGGSPLAPDHGAPFFLVDPLDGTREYINGGNDFTLNVALIDRDGQPVFGLVYAPALAELYVTIGPNRAIASRMVADGGPAHLDTLPATRLATRPMPETGARVGMVSRRDRAGRREEEMLTKLGIGPRVAIGSSLKFCRLARGEADVYPRLTSISEWDIAAGDAVLRASGGGVHNLAGRPLRYGQHVPSFRTSPFIAAGVPRPIHRE